MQTLIEWLQNETNYKRALVHLWRLAKKRDEQGNLSFDTWRKGYHPENHRTRIKKAKEWLKTKNFPVNPFDVQAIYLAMMSALDDLLAEKLRAERLLPSIEPVKDDANQEYWVIPRKPSGFLFKQPVYLDFFHPNNLIMKAKSFRDEIGTIDFSIKPFDCLDNKHPNQLRLAIANFNDDYILQGDELGQSRFFTCTSNDDARLHAAKEMMVTAEKQGAHILLFPELTLSPANQSAVRDWLEQRLINNESSPLLLIGLGSFHENCKESNQNIQRNRAHVIYGSDGRVLIEQDKFCPAAAGKGETAINENFARGCRVNAVMTPFGLLGVAICKDLFDESAEWIWKHLSPSWLLVPSMSDQLDRHKEKTAELLKRHGCTSAVANQNIPPIGQLTLGYLETVKDKSGKTRIDATDYLHVFEIPLIQPDET